MCIIVVIPAGVEAPSKDTLFRCFSRNDDYMGFMYVDGGDKLNIYKYKIFLNFYDSFTDKWEKLGKTTPFVIHFRLASQGSVTLENTHPFFVSPELAFCHNGTITDPQMVSGSYAEKDMSDSRLFNHYILKELPSNWMEFPILISLVTDFVSPSRLVFLHKDRSYLIIGEKFSGAAWIDGCWYSCRIPDLPTPVIVNNTPVCIEPKRASHYLDKCACCGLNKWVSEVKTVYGSLVLCTTCEYDSSFFSRKGN